MKPREPPVSRLRQKTVSQVQWMRNPISVVL